MQVDDGALLGSGLQAESLPKKKGAEKSAQSPLKMADLEFSRHTFVMKVLEEEEEFWPFLEFTEQGDLKEAFCTCEESEEEEEGAKCAHISFAIEQLTLAPRKRLSSLFLNHFWHRLFYQIAQDDRFEASYEQEPGEGLGEEPAPLLTTIEAPWGVLSLRLFEAKLQAQVREIMDEKLTYEPSSLRFSTLSAQELALWRQGRPGPTVRYELSICSLLARLFFLRGLFAKHCIIPSDPPIQVHFEASSPKQEGEDRLEESSRKISMQIKAGGLFEMRLRVERGFFLPLLPLLPSLQEGIVYSYTPLESLKALELREGKVHFRYCEKKLTQAKALLEEDQEPLCPGSNWYSIAPGTRFLQEGICYIETPPQEWPQQLEPSDFLALLQEWTQQERAPLLSDVKLSSPQEKISSQERCIPIDVKPKELQYSLKINEKGDLFIAPYLEEVGDLDYFLMQKEATLKGRSALMDEASSNDHFEGAEHGWILGDWVYLPQKGLQKLTQPLSMPTRISKEQMPAFIEGHRSFLNRFPGFVCWTHGLDFKIEFRVDEEGLEFYSPFMQSKESVQTYGHWIYVPTKGFFLDHAQLKEFQGVYHGMRVPSDDLEAFLDQNHTTTEIHNFWAKESPLEGCFLEATLQEEEPSVALELVEQFKEKYQSRERRRFGHYEYVQGEGFWRYLPSERPSPQGVKEGVMQGSTLARWIEEVHKPRSLHRRFFKSYPTFLRSLAFDRMEITDAQEIDEEVQKKLEGFYGRVYRIKLSFCCEKGEKIELAQIERYPLLEQRWILTQRGLIDLYDRSWRWLMISKNAQKRCEELVLEREALQEPWAFVDVLTLFKWNLRKQLKIDSALQVVERLESDLQLLMGQEVPLPDLRHLKSILRPYQRLGVKWLWQLYRLGLGGLLCDDMGLGKTHQVMALMAAIWASSSQSRTFFIACPTSVVFHWQSQLARFLPDVPVRLYHGSDRSLPQSFEGIVLTTYGVCRLDIAHLERHNFSLAVYDEVQLAKNAQSRIYKSLERIQAQIRIGLSGTPVENSLKDLKALMDLTVAGWMPPQKQFEEEFLIPLERFGDQEVVSKIKNHIHPFVLRREKSEVLDDLPDKVISTHVCSLSDDQRAIYQSVLQQARGSLRERLGEGERGIPYLHIFSALNSLKQICDHPAVYFRNRGQSAHRHEYDCDKWDLFCYLLSEALGSGQKVVIFSQYLAMLDLIEEYLYTHDIGYASVRGNTRQRGEKVARFQNDPDCRVFVASLHAAGVGIDLTAGSVVILYDRWWNAAKENQAIDRVHRIGQTRGVQVIRLIVQGTIEEKIDAIIERKAQLMKEAVVTDDHRFLKSLSEDEILALLDFNQEEEPSSP